MAARKKSANAVIEEALKAAAAEEAAAAGNASGAPTEKEVVPPAPNEGMESLLAALKEVEDGLGGEGKLGVAATYLNTGATVAYNAEEVFPTASVIKIAIVTELFLQALRGKVAVDGIVTVRHLDMIQGSGVLKTLSPGRMFPLRDLATLTISVSDNTASNLCLRAVGGPAAVNKRMKEAWGMKKTVIHRPIKFNLSPDDPKHTATGTPADMLKLVMHLAEGTTVPRSVADEVLRRMGMLSDGDLLPRHLDVNPYAAEYHARPPLIVRHKTGGVDGTRNDAGLINRGEDTLAVCVYTKDVFDPRWTSANRASEAVARVGKLLCDHFFGE